ncbi:glycosyltransferase family 4 protein [Candidatus Woesearchaeota archaeon]|nr:glycosyltransferase family 4 protein [Candidatus Woesearchaeota archaeon]
MKKYVKKTGKIRVYFHQMASHRERQKDTVIHAPTNIIPLSPLKRKENLDNIGVFNKLQKKTMRNRLEKIILPLVPLLHVDRMPPMHSKADYVYTWSTIPLGCRKPFIIEVDNPYTLTYYNYRSFQLYKPIIRRVLLSPDCHKVVCMSEACRLQMIKELGQGVGKKCVVSYPFMKWLGSKKRINYGEPVRFLFVGLKFDIKGGKEALKAFSECKNRNTVLDVVGNVDSKYIEKYRHDKRIRFLGLIPRKELFRKVFPEHDVLLFPTLHESFGLVALEALSFGLGIITTNTYALSELVKHGFNGYLMKNPYMEESRFDTGKETEKGKIAKGTMKFSEVTRYTLDEFEKRNLIRERFSKKLFFETKKAIEAALKNHVNWRRNARQVFASQFTEKKWKENFSRIFKYDAQTRL